MIDDDFFFGDVWSNICGILGFLIFLNNIRLVGFENLVVFLCLFWIGFFRVLDWFLILFLFFNILDDDDSSTI